MNLSEEKRMIARRSDEEILAACAKQASYDERRALLSLDGQPGEEASDSVTSVSEALSPGSIELMMASPALTPTRRKRRAFSVDEESAVRGGKQLTVMYIQYNTMRTCYSSSI